MNRSKGKKKYLRVGGDEESATPLTNSSTTQDESNLSKVEQELTSPISYEDETTKAFRKLGVRMTDEELASLLTNIGEKEGILGKEDLECVLQGGGAARSVKHKIKCWLELKRKLVDEDQVEKVNTRQEAIVLVNNQKEEIINAPAIHTGHSLLQNFLEVILIGIFCISIFAFGISLTKERKISSQIQKSFTNTLNSFTLIGGSEYLCFDKTGCIFSSCSSNHQNFTTESYFECGLMCSSNSKCSKFSVEPYQQNKFWCLLVLNNKICDIPDSSPKAQFCKKVYQNPYQAKKSDVVIASAFESPSEYSRMVLQNWIDYAKYNNYSLRVFYDKIPTTQEGKLIHMHRAISDMVYISEYSRLLWIDNKSIFPQKNISLINFFGDSAMARPIIRLDNSTEFNYFVAENSPTVKILTQTIISNFTSDSPKWIIDFWLDGKNPECAKALERCALSLTPETKGMLSTAANSTNLTAILDFSNDPLYEQNIRMLLFPQNNKTNENFDSNNKNK